MAQEVKRRKVRRKRNQVSVFAIEGATSKTLITVIAA